MGIWYATREQVQASLEISNTSRTKSIVDSKIEAASRSVEGQLHRRFYPELKTLLFDWPNFMGADSWQLLLGANELISVVALTSGGTTISASDFFLRRFDDLAEPPYTSIEINLTSAAAFSSSTTFQRAISVRGLYGWNDTDTSSLAGGVLGANINSSVTSLVINPTGGNFNVGVGSLILIGTERLILTGRSMSTTAQSTQGALTASQNSDTVLVSDGTAFAVDELILVNSERMKIVDIAGNSLIVRRAWDGTTLAAHSSLQTIFAARTFTASRAALGTTAAAHTAADPIYPHIYPGLINELCIAESVVMLEQNAAGYARVVGSGDNQRESAGKGLEDLRCQVYTRYGRKLRSGAI